MRKSGHILVVDENVPLVDTVRSLLESQGYRVSCAYVAEQALELAAEVQPSLVVLDSSFAGPPALEGGDLLRPLERLGLGATPVLILMDPQTARERLAWRQTEAPYGPPRTYLEKPFRPRELLAKVEELLALGEVRGEGVSATVLVVDDDPDFVDVTTRILRANGYGVLTAVNGKEALDLLRRHPADLVLLDIMMSTVLDGVGVSEAMRADPALRRIPIIMVSSIAQTEYAAAFPVGQDIHIQDWITKPVRPEELLQKVARQLG